MGDRSLLLTFCVCLGFSVSEGSHGEKWSVPGRVSPALGGRGDDRRPVVRAACGEPTTLTQRRPAQCSGCRGAWLYLASMEHQGCSVGASFLTHGISPQARSPSPAPIATAPSLTAPTCAPTFRPTPT